ncbi:MAG TPA: hypothetical protein VGE98_07890, partial [Thermoanaerobaculia bacterium]
MSNPVRTGLHVAAVGLAAALAATPLAAQSTSQQARLPLQAIAERTLPADTVRTLMAGPAELFGVRKLAGGRPRQVAARVGVRYTLASDGTRELLADGGTLWRLRVTSPGALFLSFALEDVTLPPGTTLRFVSVDRAAEAGPYTAADMNPTRRFGSPALAGDSAVIELAVPAGAPYPPSLTVASVSHGFRDFHGFAAVPRRDGGALTVAPSATEKAGVCEV